MKPFDAGRAPASDAFVPDIGVSYALAHFTIKGIEVAAACAETLHGLERLRGQVAAGIV